MEPKTITYALPFLTILYSSVSMAAFSLPGLTNAPSAPANNPLEPISGNTNRPAPPPQDTLVPVVPDQPVTNNSTPPVNHWVDPPQGNNDTGILPVIPIPLSDEEAATLLHMREEEKFARDVYLTLSDIWDSAVFGNISNSEQKHMDIMLSKVEQYGLVDPVADDTVGVFNTMAFAELYEQLTQQGKESFEAALMAGGLVEELDILDLQQAIEESDHTDIIQAYEILLRGSRNHLRQFASQIESLGLIYAAQVMTQEEVDEIINSPMERGGR